LKNKDLLAALKPVIAAFEKLSIPYYIGDSVASSVYGMARAILDADVHPINLFMAEKTRRMDFGKDWFSIVPECLSRID
jgi:hypothetical protein